MLSNRTDDAEPSVTRRSILKTGLAISAIGASSGATGIVQGGDTNETDATGDDSETHTLTVALIDSSNAGIVSGEVTVGEQTKTTIPLNGDPARIQAEFELENGTYTASGTSEINDETWRTKEKEVTIDGEDAYLSLVLYSPESDELEETEPGNDESQDDSGTDETDSDDSEDTSEETDTEEDGEKSAPSDESGDTDSTDQNQDGDNCP
ncbi:DUF3324 domain-containing protein [Halocatena marina]|uniref:DUF3324 domain-containing protein n=1 Tax=Halocatena marina TaxID=2934937 RepID=UPI00200DC1F4|nr:DUF3324 domain-containing protein [Halocatena marina]